MRKTERIWPRQRRRKLAEEAVEETLDLQRSDAMTGFVTTVSVLTGRWSVKAWSAG